MERHKEVQKTKRIFHIFTHIPFLDNALFPFPFPQEGSTGNKANVDTPTSSRACERAPAELFILPLMFLGDTQRFSTSKK
jgi:hypothetical protein